METTSVSNFSLLDMDMTFEFIGYHFTCRDGVGGIVSGSVPISAYQPTLSLSALFHCLYSPYPITIVSSTQIMLSSIVKRAMWRCGLFVESEAKTFQLPSHSCLCGINMLKR